MDRLVYDGNLENGESDIEQTLYEIAGTIGHELRNTLTPILGFAELLQGTDHLEPEQKEYVAYINKASKELKKKVDALVKCLETGYSKGVEALPKRDYTTTGLQKILDIRPFLSP